MGILCKGIEGPDCLSSVKAQINMEAAKEKIDANRGSFMSF